MARKQKTLNFLEGKKRVAAATIRNVKIISISFEVCSAHGKKLPTEMAMRIIFLL